jgi:hypothetical protein
MHPEMLRELTVQRGREMRARAHQARLGRAARRGPRTAEEADGFVMPAIPDYVDGTFKAGGQGPVPPGMAAAGSPAGRPAR